MSKTLLERLSAEVPHWNGVKNATLASVREFVKRHEAEIEEARARGYSWRQIDNAVRELYEPLLGVRWWTSKSNILIEDIYNIMKRTCKNTEASAMEFNVTVTKATR